MGNKDKHRPDVDGIRWGRVRMCQLATIIFSNVASPTQRPSPPKIGLQSFGDQHMWVIKCCSGRMESLVAHVHGPRHPPRPLETRAYLHKNTSNPL